MAVERKRIVVAGEVCADLTPVFPDENADFYELLQPGKLVNATGLMMSAGGAVSNTGLGLSRLGADVHLIMKTGKDFLGEFLEEEMKKYPVTSSILKTDQRETAYSVVIAIAGYDRVFLHDTGSSDLLSWEEMDYDLIREACIFHFGYPPALRMFYLNDGNDLIQMYRKIKEMGTATSLDMSLPSPQSEAGRVNWRKVITEVIPYVDIFLPSIEELSYAMDRNGFQKINRMAMQQKKSFAEVVSLDYATELADELIQIGGKIVLVKCGSQGMILKTADRERLLNVGGGLGENLDGWTCQEIYIPCFEPDCVRSGTGAGDISIAAFLLALQRNYPIRRCVELAAAAGAVCVSTYDALSGIPSLEILNQRIEAGWRHSNEQRKETEE